MDNEKMKVFGYYVCIVDDEVEDSIEDRGYTFAENLSEATKNVIEDHSSEHENVVHIQIFETDYDYLNRTFSAYTLLVDFNDGKETIARELKDWCII